jgi:tetratricopeptide (TPR) repeat protein
MSSWFIQQVLANARQQHQQSNLADAEALYRQVLAAVGADQVDACHGLALACFQLNRRGEAMQWMRRAVAAAGEPGSPELLNTLGAMLMADGQTAEAVAVFERAVALRPQQPESHNNLGQALKQSGRTDDAIAAFRRAIALRADYAQALANLAAALLDRGNDDEVPEAIELSQRVTILAPASPEVHNNLASALHRGKRSPTEVAAAARRALELRAAFPEAWLNLGNALADANQPEDAAVAFRRAIAIRPDMVEAHYNLGNALQNIRRFDEAIAAYDVALRLRPDHIHAMNNRGNALQKIGRYEEAVAALERALQLKPDHHESRVNLGNVFQRMGRLDDANAAYRRVLAVRPDDADAHWNLGMSLLLAGEFREGWAEYEWRWRRSGAPPRREFAGVPQWFGRDDQPIDGKTILIHVEQGFGDAIQMARYVPLLAARGARVMFECPPALKRLLQTLAGVERVVMPDELLGHIDFHCPIMSLPYAFGTMLVDVPASTPYLHADVNRRTYWDARVRSTGSGLKVGVAWAGRPAHSNDHNRSLSLQQLECLAHVPNVRWFSLQKEPPKPSESGPAMIDWTAELSDFAETAALVVNLDLVISIDSAPAHLGGALGRATWVLLPFAPDYRWMLGREDSPWYPTMRLFRQSRVNEWEEPIARMCDALRALASSSPS